MIFSELDGQRDKNTPFIFHEGDMATVDIASSQLICGWVMDLNFHSGKLGKYFERESIKAHIGVLQEGTSYLIE